MRSSAILILALSTACLKDLRKDATSAAQTRAQIELQCTVLSSAVESEQGVPGGHRYQVGVQGCGQYRAYPVMCQTGGSCRIEPTAVDGAPAPSAPVPSAPAP
jgi:hypothetical protein